MPIADAFAVARSARLELFVPLVLFAVVGWFALESLAYAYVFSRFNAPVSLPEARALRGMSYLLTPIHWNVGKAAVVLRLRQTKRIPILESTSTVMLYQSIDALVLTGLAAVGMAILLGSDPAPDPLVSHPISRLRWGAVALLLSTFGYLWLVRSDRPRSRSLDRFRGLSIHHAHRRSTWLDLLIIAGIKSAYHLGYAGVVYLGLRAFEIELPVALVLAATPIVQAVGAIPISPAGLGTQQAAMLFFLGDRFGGTTDEASLVAFGVSLPVVLILGRYLLGLLYLKDFTAPRTELDRKPVNPAYHEPADTRATDR